MGRCPKLCTKYVTSVTKSEMTNIFPLEEFLSKTSGLFNQTKQCNMFNKEKYHISIGSPASCDYELAQQNNTSKSWTLQQKVDTK